MRIALVSQEYPPETAKGGIGSQTYLKAHGLKALGHEVHVISRSTAGQRTERDDHGVHVTRIPGLNARIPVYNEATDWLGYSAEVAVAVTSLHAASPLDLVEFPEWGAEGYLYLLNQSEWNRIATVVQLHGPLVMFAHTLGWPDKNSEFYRTGSVMEATCLRRADAVFSSSHCSADWCAKHYGLNRADIPVIHTGVDTQTFSPHAEPKAERPTIVFAGKLAANKGVHLLVAAACELAREFPGLQLRLLGRSEPKLAAELHDRAQAAGQPGLLDLPGFVDRTELPVHFSRAHVFAAPSQYEGGPGFVYLEAMACGLPVIACAGSGAAEAVRDGETGILIPPQDVPALTAALRSLLQDAARRDRMGAAARQFVLTEADSRTCVKRIAEFYHSVVTGKVGRGARA